VVPAALSLISSVRPRVYGAASVVAFALLVGLGVAMLSWRKRRFEKGGDVPYRPPQGRNEMELNPFARPAPPPTAADPAEGGPDSPPRDGTGSG
jgi:hypothetical protein